LQSATWLHEVGIASNRSSLRCGEYFSIQVQTARQASEVGNSGNYRDLFYFLLFLKKVYYFFISFIIIFEII